jgi:hypothetical protein
MVRHAAALIAFAVAASWRVALLAGCPAAYSWDVFLRVFHGDRLFVSHWLPLPQLFVALGRASGLGIAPAQWASIAGAALAAAMLAELVQRGTGRPLTGLAAGLALGLLPALSTISVMPYQEPLALPLLVASAILFSERSRPVRAAPLALLMVVACACRYEAWVLVVVAMAWSVIRRNARIATSLVPCVIVSIALLASWRFLGAPPDPALEDGVASAAISPGGPARLAATLLQVVTVLADSLSWPVLIAALVGAVTARRALTGFGALLLVAFGALTAVAVGRGYSAGFVTARMVLWPGAIAVAFAAMGLDSAVERLPVRGAIKRAVFAAFAVAALAPWAARGFRDVAAAAAPYVDDAALAAAIEDLPGSPAVVLAPQWQPLSHGVGSVLANAPGLERRGDDRLVHREDRNSRPPDYAAYWTARGYVICRLHDEDRTASSSRSSTAREIAARLVERRKRAPASVECLQVRSE